MDMKAINEQVIRQHRAGEQLSVPGMHRERIVLLTTTGAKSGDPHTAPMLFIPAEGGALVVASAAREATWQRIIVDYPFLVDQQEGAGRPLPLVRLVEVGA